MTDPRSPANATPAAAPNLKITFWGVQGSCPIFPNQAEVEEYARRLAVGTIEKTLLDLARRMERETEPVTSATLRQLADSQNIAKYQEHLGLVRLPIYGGDTTCIEVLTAEGNTLLFDMGTGMRDFSSRVAEHWTRGPRILHVFASHEHLDHRSGLPFSSFCFDRKDPFTVHVHGTRQFLTALDDRYGIYSHQLTPFMHVDDPLDYRMIAATFTGSEIRTALSAGDIRPPFTMPVRHVGEPIAIGNTTITPFEVYHGITQCLAYKVRHGSSTFVFCTDHELRHGSDATDERQVRSLAAERRLIEQCQDVDLAYFDGQYFLAEYTGKEGIGGGPAVPRMDWGHTCIEDVVARVAQCGVRRAFIGHHDPERLWGQRVEIDRKLSELSLNQPYHIELAKSGAMIEV
jgi:phosphoribosyl 1,2-cyclic phosphodiesterase